MNTEHNAHLAYLKFDNIEQRNTVLNYLNLNDVPASFHYVTLDNSVEGKRNAQSENICANSFKESNRLLRLPMHNYISESDQTKIVSTLKAASAIR